MDKKINKKTNKNETVAEMVTGMEAKAKSLRGSSKFLMKERTRRIMGEIKAALKKSLNGLSPKASAKVIGSFREKEKDLKKAIKKWILKQP